MDAIHLEALLTEAAAPFLACANPAYNTTMTAPDKTRLIVVRGEADMSDIGSIEVETFAHSNRVVDKVICMPPEDNEERRRAAARRRKYEAVDEGVEVTPSLLENISLVMMNGCACAGGPMKGALRKKPVNGRACSPQPALGDRNVSFSSLEIREFGMTLGDHPSAVSGPPVAMDWNGKASQRTVNVDEYELLRSPRRKRRQLKLSYHDRRAILENEKKFTTEEVNRAWAEALRIRQQRQETLKRGLMMMLWDDAWESAQRKYNRAIDSISIF